jgi:prevent-host-death family protein
MDTVGIRELKAHLSRHLKRVRSGAKLIVTQRGRSIAIISPVQAPADLTWAHRLVAEHERAISIRCIQGILR